ncbi:MAG: prepilin-type N-terminal cleavage/methylation domain-containing protein [Planctomycetota bacterium]
MRPARAFTLVELLVVIGIIALLVGILLPVLSTARSSGIDVVCRNNLRQIYTAQSLYAEDFGTFTDTDRTLLKRYKWIWQLTPYIDESTDRQTAYENRNTTGPHDVLWCPAEPRGDVPNAHFSYGINSFIAMEPWDHKPTVASPEISPADLILHADKAPGGQEGEQPFVLTEDGRTLRIYTEGVNDTRVYGVNVSTGHSSYGAFRHARNRPDRSLWDADIAAGSIGGSRDVKGVNAVFLDGHVESLSRSRMWSSSPSWHPRIADLSTLDVFEILDGPCCQ